MRYCQGQGRRRKGWRWHRFSLLPWCLPIPALPEHPLPLGPPIPSRLGSSSSKKPYLAYTLTLAASSRLASNHLLSSYKGERDVSTPAPTLQTCQLLPYLPLCRPPHSSAFWRPQYLTQLPNFSSHGLTLALPVFHCLLCCPLNMAAVLSLRTQTAFARWPLRPFRPSLTPPWPRSP